MVADEKQEFELWPENELPLLAMMRCRNCWRIAPMGGLIGLDWSQVEIRLRQMRISRKDRAWVEEGLEILEALVLDQQR